MREISAYAQGVGPYKGMIVFSNSTSSSIYYSTLVQNAHANNMVVHPWTFRSDQMPIYTSDINRLFQIFFFGANVDGVFTDFPDKAVKFLANNPQSSTTTPSVTSTTNVAAGKHNGVYIAISSTFVFIAISSTFSALVASFLAFPTCSIGVFFIYT